jgi:CarD family transcriptional regulator
MFEVGDKIVHPQHGAGVIKNIEKDVIQEFGRYYVIELAAYNRTLMVPVDKAPVIGVRLISGPDTMSKVLITLSGEPDSLPGNYTERQTRIGERLKKGDVFEVAEVIRDLSWRSQSKHLTTQDSGFLEQARRFLASELALVRGINFDQAMSLLNGVMATE